MRALFLRVGVRGATNEAQRKALADYCAPTIVQTKTETAGSTGLFGGDSLVAADRYPHGAAQTGTRAMTIPRDAVGGPREASGREREAESKKFNLLAQSLKDRLQRRADLKRLARNLCFTETLEGLRIDIVDDADVSMFAIGTSQLTPRSEE